MKKLFFFTAITFLMLISCRKEKEIITSEGFTSSKNVTISSELQSPKIETSTATSNSVQAVPIQYQETSAIEGERWNPCSEEFVDFEGTIHTKIRGIITDNKITFVLHLNVSNVRAIGRSSGTEYITTSTFNYSNTFNFNTQFVYQQRATTNFIAQGKAGNFRIENDWHLTVNANGEVAFFFTTGGDVITCQ